jgi:predicted DNA binding protein
VTVFAELTLDTAAFEYGELLAPPEGTDTTIVEFGEPDSESYPYLWVEDGTTDVTAYERRIRDDDRVAELVCVDDHAGWRLYRLTWERGSTGVLAVIRAASATLLQVRGTASDWRFKLQFPDYGAVTALVRTLTEREVSFRLGRLSSGGERATPKATLTESQREALVLARANGYFEKSRGITQEELGEALGITRQAVSYRLRGGIQSLIDATIYGDD